jgi:hypothetical protein
MPNKRSVHQIPPTHQENFVAGEPYFFDYGYPCCKIDGVNYESDPYVALPKDIHVRVGRGDLSWHGGFHQDPHLFRENQDRVRVVPFLTDIGTTVNVIRMEGDHDDRVGGAMILKLLDNPTTWESGVGVRSTLIFSPRDEVEAQWYFNFGLRGELLGRFHNEGVECIEVTVRETLVKISYYHDAPNDAGGGARVYHEFPFVFEYNRWYKIEQRLIPIPTELNTWDAKVRLIALHDPSQRIVWRAAPDQRPNHIVSVEHRAAGDEHMGLPDGGVFYFSHWSDVAIPPRVFDDPTTPEPLSEK